MRDVDLARLINLPALEELNLDSCPVGDWAITYFADNNVTPNLISLDLADTDLTDSGMAHLPKFKNITRLSLFYCSISNVGLEHMAAMTNLEVLNLDSRDVSAVIISHYESEFPLIIYDQIDSKYFILKLAIAILKNYTLRLVTKVSCT